MHLTELRTLRGQVKTRAQWRMYRWVGLCFMLCVAALALLALAS